MVSPNMVAAAALAISALSGGVAHAVELTLGGGWEPFYNLNPGTPTPIYGGPIYDYYTGDTDFTFTLTTTARLNITDTFYNLDMFDLVINGVDQGPTSTPLQDYAEQDDPDLAFIDPHFSHGSYKLTPGTYDVTGTSIYSPYGYNVGFIEVTVPEPAAWAMMLIGFGVIGGAMRRGRKRAAIAARTIAV